MKTSPPNSCNVLSLATDRRHLWRFSTGGGQASLTTEQNGAVASQLPQNLVGKDWRTLVSPKLNLAWLPLDQVFLRVVQLPKCDYTELLAMLEFQLEKISPLPVAQIVWSAEIMPVHSHAPSELQTVLVLIASREHVEEFIGRLEGTGFLPDQLEIPFLNQLLATKVAADGAWFYVMNFGGKTLGLTAWWYNGVLQTLHLLHLSSPQNFRSEVGEQLTKTAWAGELEGWLTSPPAWHLVAAPDVAAAWHQAFGEWAAKSVEVVTALPEAELARLSAQRVARGEARVNLLPTEYGVRYRQQLIDRVWMRALSMLLLVYIMGVLAYLGALSYAKIQLSNIEKDVAALTDDYTRAQRTKALIQVVRSEIGLKYAALECWKAISSEMPEQLVLSNMTFSKGKNVLISGYSSEASKVTDYNEALLNLKLNDAKFFSRAEVRSSRLGAGPGGGQSTLWTIECELAGREGE